MLRGARHFLSTSSRRLPQYLRAHVSGRAVFSKSGTSKLKMVGVGIGIFLGGSLSLASPVISHAEQHHEAVPASSQKPKTTKTTVSTGKNEVQHFDFVIVGGGIAAYAAVEVLKSGTDDADIAMVCAEQYLPYDRHLLSKEQFWNSSDTADVLLYPSETFEDVFMFLDNAVQALEPSKRLMKLRDGTVISYGKCLLASGSSPITLEAPHPPSKVTTFHSRGDFEELESIMLDPTVSHVTVVGGSRYSGELACSLNSFGKKTNTKVTYLLSEPGIMSELLPPYLSEQLNQRVKAAGVDLRTNVEVVSVDKEAIHLSSGESIKTDHVVVSIGSKPNTSYARGDLELDPINDGFVCNPQLKIRSGIWAAGDVASYWDQTLGRKRYNYLEHAGFSGIIAAQNMLGKKEDYFTWPIYEGAILGNEFSFVGEIDSKLETVSVWQKGVDHDASRENIYEKEKKYSKGVVYYMRGQKIVGVLLWNNVDRWMIDGALGTVRRLERVYASPADVVRAVPWEEPAL